MEADCFSGEISHMRDVLRPDTDRAANLLQRPLDNDEWPAQRFTAALVYIRWDNHLDVESMPASGTPSVHVVAETHWRRPADHVRYSRSATPKQSLSQAIPPHGRVPASAWPRKITSVSTIRALIAHKLR